MALKPWREIAVPHTDVLKGTFTNAEFAADITQVHRGKASEEYQNPEKFFSRTYITEGMKLLLKSVIQRMAGHGGDPVIQLQTSFGGGKTHSMLAVYHLATSSNASMHPGIPPILDESGISHLPEARIVVLDGTNMSAGQAVVRDGVEIKTIWGELAWQLGKENGFLKVAESDKAGTSPSKEIIADLLRSVSPVVILIDELVAYLRQFGVGQIHSGGTFDSNITFVQAMTEAVKMVPDAILLASLPESKTELGDLQGERALASLEKVFGRVESVWKPVAAEESFEIVRRRLFEKIGTDSEIQSICNAFTAMYNDNKGKFPIETAESTYNERLQSSYPIHPEIFDRLYGDWSTLDKFQRTRGVLQYMAIIIHRLWINNNQEAMILPGSIPLDDVDVRTKSIHYLPQGWEPIIESEVDGHRSTAAFIEKDSPLFGSVQAARRTMRTIFLGSAPSHGKELSRGLKHDRVLLGSVLPGQQVSVYEDVLKRVCDRMHYLFVEKERYWLDTRPNLRREMEGRKQKIDYHTQLFPEMKNQIAKTFGSSSHGFSGIHVFSQSGDVPDEIGNGLRLVVLPPEKAFTRAGDNQALSSALDILKNRGNAPRTKQNRLIFVAADAQVVGRLIDQFRILLAWESIVTDNNNEVLNLDTFQKKQAEKNVEASKKIVRQMIREAYKWLLVPTEKIINDTPTLKWIEKQISPSVPNILNDIERILKEEELLIVDWAPIHLKNLLEKFYFVNNKYEVEECDLWGDMCEYPFMPKLKDQGVLAQTIAKGLLSTEYFGHAAGKENDTYIEFCFGKGTIIRLEAGSIIIERSAAEAYAKSLEETASNSTSASASIGDATPESRDAGNRATNTKSGFSGANETPADSKPAPVKRTQYYGTVDLDPLLAKARFNDIYDEIVQLFTEQLGTSVTINVEITAVRPDGFNDSTIRAVSENSRTLKFKNSEFEQ